MDEHFLLELGHEPVSTLEELNRRYWAWVEEVYQVRVHSETQQTPLARWLNGGLARPLGPARVAEVFLWRTYRKADATAVISFEGNRYQLPSNLARKRVQVRYHPLALDRLQIWQDGRRIALAGVLDLHNRVLRQVAEKHRLPAQAAAKIPYLELLVQKRDSRQQAALSPLRFTRSEEE